MMMKPTCQSIPLAAAVVSCLLLALPTTVNSQALTPEQLTQQIRVLGERSENNAKTLQGIQQELTRIGRQIDNRAMLELMQSVQELAHEISQLRGEIEQQGNDLNQVKKRQRELYLDVDRRLRDLESRGTAQVPAPIEVPGLDRQQPASPAPAPSAQPAARAATPADGGAAATSEGSALIADTMATPAAGAPAGNGSVSQEQSAYQAAFETMKEGRYEKAKAEFKRFLQQYPDSAYAGNAQYWLGEANYVTKNFDQAFVEFELVLTRYPSSNKVPAAMLKLGYTYYEKKIFDRASVMLQELRKRYPKSTEARLAGQRLDRIRKEGN